MNVTHLHRILSQAIMDGHGDAEILVSIHSFPEYEDETVMPFATSAKVRQVQGADDSGPTGELYPMLVISGNPEAAE